MVPKYQSSVEQYILVLILGKVCATQFPDNLQRNRLFFSQASELLIIQKDLLLNLQSSHSFRQWTCVYACCLWYS